MSCSPVREGRPPVRPASPGLASGGGKRRGLQAGPDCCSLSAPSSPGSSGLAPGGRHALPHPGRTDTRLSGPWAWAAGVGPRQGRSILHVSLQAPTPSAAPGTGRLLSRSLCPTQRALQGRALAQNECCQSHRESSCRPGTQGSSRHPSWRRRAEGGSSGHASQHTRAPLTLAAACLVFILASLTPT